MFVRKKNRSDSTSVVVADKSSGRFKELVTIGVGSGPEEIERLCIQGKEWIDRHKGQLSFDFLSDSNFDGIVGQSDYGGLDAAGGAHLHLHRNGLQTA